MKTACVYHSVDLDGWMSAAIVKHYFNVIDAEQEKQTGQSQRNFHQRNFIGYNYGQTIPDLTEYDHVIMCDISFPKDEMMHLTSFDNRKNQHVEWIDHHVSAISDAVDNGYEDLSGLRDTKFAACELTWKYFFSNVEMPEIVRLLGRYDCFGHKGTEEEIKVLEFQYGARRCITNYLEAYIWLHDSITNISNVTPEEFIYDQGKPIYQYLRVDAKHRYKNGFEIQFRCSEAFIVSKNQMTNSVPSRLHFICINNERFNPINFGIDYHSDGYDGCACFYFDGTNYNFSLYNDNGLVDCSVIAKQYGGGGHKGASGFILSPDKFNELVKIHGA